jgi:hypothetical protein
MVIFSDYVNNTKFSNLHAQFLFSSMRFGLLLGRNVLRKIKIVHVSWETLYYLHTVNMQGKQNIKIK